MKNLRDSLSFELHIELSPFDIRSYRRVCRPAKKYAPSYTSPSRVRDERRTNRFPFLMRV